MAKSNVVVIEIIIIIILRTSFGIQISNPKGLGSRETTNSFGIFNNVLNKVSLTQKGYLQFLKYVVDVPVITEFTFCIWLKSTNLTHSQPLLSYSEHEETRFIRVWISSYGTEMNLEIMEKTVTVAANFQENHWYHICKSWDSRSGFWSYFLNGKLEARSYEPKFYGLRIPKGGDLVVGQEYTDFDKGLEDGIEGDIFGFNMILSGTTTENEIESTFKDAQTFFKRRDVSDNKQHTTYTKQYSRSLDEPPEENPVPSQYETVSSILGHFSEIGFNKMHKIIYDLGQRFLKHITEWFDDDEEKSEEDTIQQDDNYYSNKHPAPAEYVIPKEEHLSDYANTEEKYSSEYVKTEEEHPSEYVKIGEEHPSEYAKIREQHPSEYIETGERHHPEYAITEEEINKIIRSNRNGKILNNIRKFTYMPLGLKLVILSYNCAVGNGAPIMHPKVLVSWTKTPVRIFGGAVLKNVPPFC